MQQQRHVSRWRNARSKPETRLYVATHHPNYIEVDHQLTALDYVALGVLVFIAAILVGVFVFLGGWPGRVATKRRHPYTSAVSIGGWVTLVAGGVLYPIVLIWAFAGSTDAEVEQVEMGDAR